MGLSPGESIRVQAAATEGSSNIPGRPAAGAPVPAGWKLTTTQPPGEPLRLGPLRSTRCTTTAQSGSLSGQPAAGLVPAGWKSTTTASPDGLSPGARCTSSTPTVRSGSRRGHPAMGRLAPAGSKLTTTQTRAIARSSLDRAPSISSTKATPRSGSIPGHPVMGRLAPAG